MASFVGGAVGAVVGFYVGGPAGARWGWMIGSAIGAQFEEGPTVEGPRLNDLKTQTSDYGTFVPRIYGRARIGGNVFWATEVKETKNKDEVSSKGGPSQTNVTYTYSASFAVALCDNEILGVRRVWMNGELVFTASQNASSGSIRVSNEKKESIQAGGFTVYKGLEDQPVDPTMAAEDGLEKTPAYLGLAYVVFRDLQLESFGNRIPQVEFEVVAKYAGTVEGYRRVRPSETIDISAAIGDDVDQLPWGTGVGTIDPSFPGDYGNYGATICSPSGSDGPSFRYQQVRAQGPRGGVVDPPGTFTTNKKWKQASLNMGEEGQLLAKINQQAYLAPYTTNANQGSRYPVGKVGGQYAWIATTEDFGFGSGNIGSVVFGNPISNVKVMVGGKYYNQSGDALFMENGWDATALISDQTRYISGIVCASDESSMLIFTSPNVRSGSGLERQIDMYHRFSMIGTQLQLVEEVTLTEPLPWGDNFPGGGMGSSNRIWFQPMGHTAIYQFAAIGILEENGQFMWTTAGVSKNNPDPRRLLLWEFVEGGQIELRHVFTENLGSGGENMLSRAIWVSAGYCRLGCPYQYNTPFSISAYTYRGWRYHFSDFTRIEAINPTGISLAYIVADQLRRVGYQDHEFDVTELEDDVVEGYVVNALTSALGNIQPLEQCFFFDQVESSGVLRFVKRGKLPVADLTTDDMAAVEAFAESPTALESSRIQDIDLPREVVLSYLDVDADYRYGTQYDRRQITKSVSRVGVQVTVMMNADKGKHVAATMLYNAWSERERFKWSTTMKWANLEPTDVVTLTRDGITWIVRIKKKNEGANGIIEFEGVQDLPSVYDQRGVGVKPPSTTGEDIALLPPTYGLAFNAPPLTNAVDTMGWYVAAAPMTSGRWPGAVFYQSLTVTGGYTVLTASFTERSQQSAIGYSLTALNSWANGDVWDEFSRVRVQIIGSETLQSRTEEEVYNGANVAWLGGEVIQFCNVEQITANTFELSKFLRGRQGTEHYATGHISGEGFVVVNLTDTLFIPDEIGSIGQMKFIRPVTIGGNVDAALVQEFTPDGSTLKPFSPVHCMAQEDVGGTKLSWVRRARINNGWQNNIDVPLDEPSERYEIDIFSNGTFSTVLRTITVVDGTEVLYTDAEQTVDFGSPQTTLYARVYQISSRVGRGWPGTFENA